jgi:hypothetical protein
VFELTTTRDNDGNVISQQYINASGEIVSQQYVDEIVNFFGNLQGSDAWDGTMLTAQGGDGSMIDVTQMNGMTFDGRFDIMDAILQADGNSINFDPFSKPDG